MAGVPEENTPVVGHSRGANANPTTETPIPDPELVELLMTHSTAPSDAQLSKHHTFPLTSVKEIIRNNSSIKSIIQEMSEGVKLLKEESQLLDRILYKNHNRFRNDRGYKAIQILQKSVLRLLDQLSLSALSELSSVLPVGLPPASGGVSSVLLPPSSLAQYTALHVWLLHSLCQRVDYCSRSAGIYALQRLALGHFWGIGAYKLAVIARIWAVVLHMTGHVAKMLGHVRRIQKKLPPGEGLFSEEILAKIYAPVPTVAKEKKNEEKDGGEVKKFVDALDIDMGVKIKREDLVRQIEEARDVDDDPPTALKRPRENKENRKKRKKMMESSETEKSITTIKAEQAATGIKLEFISNLKSLDDVKAFLELETGQRKLDRKSSRTRKLGQDAFKALKRKLVADFNVKLPNKSIKQARKTLREALKVT